MKPTSVTEAARRRRTKEARAGRCMMVVVVLVVNFLDEELYKTSIRASFKRVFVHTGHLYSSCMKM